ncbi:UNVERIFIED_CONTAM: hypothetical protein Cloal_2714 [Acetivibrio alkalicellulosi]
MRFIDKISIKKRMSGIFIVCIFMFLVFGLFVYNSILELGNVSHKMYNQSLKVSNAASEAWIDVIKIQRDTRSIMLLDDDVTLNFELDKLRLIDERINNNLDFIRDNLPHESKGRQLESRAREIFNDWRESRKEVIDMVLDNNHDKAFFIVNVKNNEYVHQLEDILGQLSENERGVAKELIEYSKKIQVLHISRLSVFLSALLIITFVLFFIIINSILKQVNTLQEAMFAGANTGELSEVSIPGKNEISKMLDYYNKLIIKLREQFWLKDGCNNLNDELSGNKPISELTSKAISFVSRFLNAGRGILYLYNSEDEYLSINASYAFTEGDKLANKYALGEGIVGQTALEKKPILLRNIRKQEATINTGTLCEAPLNIYALPLTYEEELYGVIEVSSFEPFTILKQDFLEDAGKIISSYLYSAIQNHRISNLLKISEEAQIELREKADELKEANHVLEEQQRLLQQQTEELQQTNSQLEEQQQLLQQQSEELQQTNSQLEEQQQLLEEQSHLLNNKNSDLERSKEELIKRTEELEMASKYKSEFLANMSHELRTPLNSIILLAKMLNRKPIGDLCEKDKEKINVIYNAGQELLRLINDILDHSKIESGKIELNVTTFNSGELIENLKQMFDSNAKHKNIEFILEDYLNSRIKGDKNRILQILRNFLSNAFKFTHNGSVTLNITSDTEKGVLFSVIDTGIGISEEKLSVIFEEFQQGDGSISRKYGGTGLGLSISKKLAHNMKGEIKVLSKEGKGSTFSFYLPNALLSNNCDDQLLFKHELKNDKTKNLKNTKVILLIEDNREFVNYIKKVNEDLGVETLVAYTGKEGLSKVRNHKVDGILLDLKLPDISGVEVLREIKSTVELRRIPIHIISVCDEDNELKRMGALGYNQKPLKDEEIKEAILKMLAFSEKSTKCLLVVEDNITQQECIRELIESEDINIKVVETEKQAKFELEKTIYDAVILDLEIKEGDGINVCKYINEKNIKTPVIIYTGKDLSMDQEKIIRKYSDRVIIKTANSEERLLDEVTLFLHKARDVYQREYNVFSKMKKECALSLDKKTILIVDDDTRNLFVLASALEDYGANIIDADNGKTALNIMRNNKIDLVLMDIMMPVMNGYETIKEIRKDKDLKSIPVIALTAKSLKKDKQKCIEAGANDYISKPVDYDTLIRIIKAWIEK